MGKRGGVRQQIEASKPSSSADASEWIESLYKRGRISAVEVQKGGCACKDADPTCRKLAQIGASGKHPQNAQRDLLRHLSKGCRAPDLYVAEAPMWDVRTNRQTTGLIYCLLPFEVLDCLVTPDSAPDWCEFHDPGQEPLQRRLDT
eukprot:1636648-Alexandrium_andersonii.AAC.1